MNNLKTHLSLLPAFENSDDPVRDAILAGVKVTGITITSKDRIIAQYPVFIPNDMHYDNLKLYLEQTAEALLDAVKEKLQNNEQFEIKDLLKKDCKGCGGCH